MTLLDALAKDLRYTLRGLRRDRVFTATVVMTLAIGIGVTSIAFSQLDAVFWKPLPVAHAEELHVLSWTARALPNPSPAFSLDAYRKFADYARDAEFACSWAGRNALADSGPVAYELVSGNYFHTLGVQALRGRLITPDDDRRAALVAVIGARLWRRVYSGTADVLGRTLTINRVAYQIIGVLPEGFAGLNPADPREVMLPYSTGASLGAAVQRDLPSWRACRQVVVRVERGSSDERVRRDGQRALTDAMLVNRPRNSDGARLLLTDIDASEGISTLRQQTRQSLTLLMVAAFMVLLGACASVAGLLSARNRGRQIELATRLALGSPRWRVIRQLLTESLVLSVLGGIAGVTLAYAASPLLPDLVGEISGRNWLNPALTPGISVGPDAQVLAFSFTVTLLTALAFGLVPAAGACRADLIAMMRPLPGLNGRRHSPHRTGKALVAIQVAVSMLLVVLAGVFLATLVNLTTVSVGYDPRGLAFVTADPRATSPAAVQTTLRQLEALPGVRSASLSQWPLYNNAEPKFPICIASAAPEYQMDVEPVAPRFFETWGVHLLRGREFAVQDQGPSAVAGHPAFFEYGAEAALGLRAAIVNQALVRKFYGGRDPLGQELGVGPCPGHRLTIVGVVADHLDRQRVAVTPMVYVPFPVASVGPFATFAVRGTGSAEALIPSLRQFFARTDFAIDGDVMTGTAYQEREWRKERMVTSLLMFFSAIALLISCLGVYGIVEHMVRSRTPELGVRLALGASRNSIIRIVMTASALPVAVGIAAGVAAAALVTTWFQTFLFRVSHLEPLILIVAAGVLTLTALVAAFLPARHSARIAPVIALRHP